MTQGCYFESPHVGMTLRKDQAMAGSVIKTSEDRRWRSESTEASIQVDGSWYSTFVIQWLVIRGYLGSSKHLPVEAARGPASSKAVCGLTEPVTSSLWVLLFLPVKREGTHSVWNVPSHSKFWSIPWHLIRETMDSVVWAPKTLAISVHRSSTAFGISISLRAGLSQQGEKITKGLGNPPPVQCTESSALQRSLEVGLEFSHVFEGCSVYISFLIQTKPKKPTPHDPF